MGPCALRFCRAFFIKSSFFQASTKSSHMEHFCVVTLLASSAQQYMYSNDGNGKIRKQQTLWTCGTLCRKIICHHCMTDEKLDWNVNDNLRVQFRRKHPYRGFWCLSYLKAWQRLLLTLLPSIFMTGVHPPSPHPKSPMWQRTDVGFESKITVIIRVLLHKEDTFWLTITAAWLAQLRAPVCWAGGRGFKPWPGQHSGSLKWLKRKCCDIFKQLNRSSRITAPFTYLVLVGRKRTHTAVRKD